MTLPLTYTKEERAFVSTPAGMAHVAGSGPQGKTCRECVHWAGDDKQRYASGGKDHAAGELKPAGCRKWKAMMRGVKGWPKITHRQKACRHFEQNPLAPTIIKAFSHG